MTGKRLEKCPEEKDHRFLMLKRMNQFSLTLRFKAVVLKFSCASETPGKLAIGSHLQSSVGLWWDLRTCISNTLRFAILNVTGTNSKYVKLKIL